MLALRLEISRDNLPITLVIGDIGRTVCYLAERDLLPILRVRQDRVQGNMPVDKFLEEEGAGTKELHLDHLEMESRKSLLIKVGSAEDISGYILLSPLTSEACIQPYARYN